MKNNNYKKKYTITAIILSSILLTIVNIIIHGVDVKYIADYMPNPDMNWQTPFWMVCIGRAFLDSILNIIISVILTTIISLIFYKKNIYRKEEKDTKKLILMLLLIPIFVSAIYLISRYSYTC